MERLEEANQNVDKLQIQLKDEEPALRKTEEEVQVMLVKIEADQKIAGDKKTLIQKEEREAKIEQERAQLLADDVQRQVKEVEKDLEETLKEMDKLN